MQKIGFRVAGRFLSILGVVVFGALQGKAQSVYLPQSYQFYQKFNADVYSKSNNMHTSLRPFLVDSLLGIRNRQLMGLGVDSSRKNWITRKLFNEHLFEIN